MSSIIGQRLDVIIHEISELKKILILQEFHKKKRNSDLIIQWGALKKKVSEKWDSLSVGDEIQQQREKQF